MHLLELVGLLRDAVPKTRNFNIFSAIRCESDEVFLHSRLIAGLIDSRCHGHAQEVLSRLLLQFEIPPQGENSFLMRRVQVRTEFRGIDILLTNDVGQAIIVENKIYANDQPKQLRRYYDVVRNLGYSKIFVRYLTLDGREPSAQSLDGLGEMLSHPWLGTASYCFDIRQWLDEVAVIGVRDAARRETVFQYQEIIDRLTGQELGEKYMRELVSTLLRGDNMIRARDVSAAYKLALIELQERFWSELIESFRLLQPEIASYLVQKSVADPRERKAAVAKYYDVGKKERMYYGLCLSVPGYEDVEVWLQIERALYVGAICENGRSSKEYRQIAQTVKDAGIVGESNDEWPIWWFIREDQNFQHPDEDLLTMLCDEQQRREFLIVCSNALAQIWRAVAQAQPIKKRA